MADIQTPEKGSHSKHGKGKVRSKKNVNQGRFYPNGGFGVPVDFLLYVDYHAEQAGGHGAEYA